MHVCVQMYIIYIQKTTTEKFRELKIPYLEILCVSWKFLKKCGFISTSAMYFLCLFNRTIKIVEHILCSVINMSKEN